MHRPSPVSRNVPVFFRTVAVGAACASIALLACYAGTDDDGTTGTRTPTSAYVPTEAPSQNPVPPGAGPPPPGPEDPPDPPPPGDSGSSGGNDSGSPPQDSGGD